MNLVRFQFYGRWLDCNHLLFYVSVIIVNLGYLIMFVSSSFNTYVNLPKKKIIDSPNQEMVTPSKSV
jgi:hypothetical protein